MVFDELARRRGQPNNEANREAACQKMSELARGHAELLDPVEPAVI
jgi:hypothetical protein